MELDLQKIQGDLQSLSQRRQQVQGLLGNFSRSSFKGPDGMQGKRNFPAFRGQQQRSFSIGRQSINGSSQDFQTQQAKLQALKSKVIQTEEQVPKSQLKSRISQAKLEDDVDGIQREDSLGEKRKDGDSQNDTGPKVNKRIKRLFGSLVGTLQQFRQEEANERQENTARKLELQELAEKRHLEEQQKIQLQIKIEKIQTRKEELIAIREVNLDTQIVQLQQIFVKKYQHLQDINTFLKTKKNPQILWMPHKHNERTDKMVEQQKELVEQIFEDMQNQLSTDTQELKDEAQRQSDVIITEDIPSLEAAENIENEILIQFRQERKNFNFDQSIYSKKDLLNERNGSGSIQDKNEDDDDNNVNNENNNNSKDLDNNLQNIKLEQDEIHDEEFQKQKRSNLDQVDEKEINHDRKQDRDIEKEEIYKPQKEQIHPAEFLIMQEQQQRRQSLKSRLGNLKEEIFPDLLTKSVRDGSSQDVHKSQTDKKAKPDRIKPAERILPDPRAQPVHGQQNSRRLQEDQGSDRRSPDDRSRRRDSVGRHREQRINPHRLYHDPYSEYGDKRDRQRREERKGALDRDSRRRSEKYESDYGGKSHRDRREHGHREGQKRKGRQEEEDKYRQKRKSRARGKEEKPPSLVENDLKTRDRSVDIDQEVFDFDRIVDAREILNSNRKSKGVEVKKKQQIVDRQKSKSQEASEEYQGVFQSDGYDSENDQIELGYV